MSPGKLPVRQPRWFWIPLRVLLVTLLLTLLSLAVSLLLGILGIVATARLRGTAPNLTLAYRYVAVPVAAVLGIMALVYAVALEVRHYRQTEALAKLERMSQ